jgi:gentisate 1,2-dioxygenase
MADEQFQARYRTLGEIRSSGAIGNLQDGPEITANGVRTRLIAWPGNGFQTESVHVLTLRPGEESDIYAHGMAEEAMLCLSGCGEVLLRDGWTEIHPGDIAYYPEAVAHGSAPQQAPARISSSSPRSRRPSWSSTSRPASTSEPRQP